MSDARTSQDFDLDEDLFDFPEVSYESDAPAEEEDLEEIFATFREASRQEELLEVPTHAPVAQEREPAAPLPAPAPAPRAVREPSIRSVEPAPRTGRIEEEHRTAAAAGVPAPAPARLSRGVVAIAVAVTVLNSVVALVALRRPGQAPAPVEQVSREPARTETSTAHAAAARVAEPAHSLPDPEAVEASHSHPTLDQAREHIARGEYASARQGVYGLLAIIDRLDDPRRGALEADCQFLIAQSLHLEALARMGDGR